jgi:Protein of unknown function (DUF541)
MTRLTRLGCAAAALALLVAPSALAQETPTGGKTVTGLGSGAVKVDKPSTLNDQTIRKAVLAARQAAVPKAVVAAQAEAQRLAAGAGLTLGGLQSISEEPASPYGPFGFYGELGTFGPGRYCGTVTRVQFHRTKSGRRVPGKRRRVHTCRVPSQVSVSVAATYAAS